MSRDAAKRRKAVLTIKSTTMGLDTTHNAFHGPYRSFGEFRIKLANFVGINLHEMYGFGGDRPWKEIKDDVKILLAHSDCDGHITPAKCKKLAARLRELLKTIPKEEGPAAWFGLYARTEQFAKGCELAAKKKENLEFH